MYIKIKNKKIKLITLNDFKSRIKCLRFDFKTLDHAILIPKKKFVNTNFFCQKVDIIQTDKDNKILKIKENIRSEKYIIPKLKTYNTYFFPLGYGKKYNLGDTIKVIEEEQKNTNEVIR